MYYRVYINGVWCIDYDTYDECETFINAHAHEGACTVETVN